LHIPFQNAPPERSEVTWVESPAPTLERQDAVAVESKKPNSREQALLPDPPPLQEGPRTEPDPPPLQEGPRAEPEPETAATVNDQEEEPREEGEVWWVEFEPILNQLASYAETLPREEPIPTFTVPPPLQKPLPLKEPPPKTVDQCTQTPFRKVPISFKPRRPKPLPLPRRSTGENTFAIVRIQKSKTNPPLPANSITRALKIAATYAGSAIWQKRVFYKLASNVGPQRFHAILLAAISVWGMVPSKPNNGRPLCLSGLMLKIAKNGAFLTIREKTNIFV